MEKRRLGDTDMELSVIGLGTWAIGGSGWDYGWGPQDDADSRAAILEALEAGINWIDTAAVYGLGHSEEIVGKTLKEWGKPVFVATKCGLIGDSKGHVNSSLEPASIEREVEASLRRLRRDVIDLYQIHWPKPEAGIERAFEKLLELKARGKIRWAAVSNFSAAQLERISRLGHVSSLQPPYSLLKRDIENDLLKWCHEHTTGVIVYSPLQTGILTDKTTRAWVQSLPVDDWRRSKSPFFKEPALSAGLDLLDQLREIASGGGRSIAELAVSWVLRRREVTAAIVGARRPGQILQVVPAGDRRLSPEELERIELAYHDYEKKVLPRRRVS